MKLKEYAKKIAKLAELHPNAKVVCASDDEGNSFQEITFAPSAGNFTNGEFDSDAGSAKVNAVCVN